MTPFGEYLAQLRRERGLPQKTIAYTIGVNPGYVSAIERAYKGGFTPLCRTPLSHRKWLKNSAYEQQTGQSHLNRPFPTILN